jgi:hypothetical protein
MSTQPRINTCLDNVFLYARFTASGQGKNRYFAPGDKMFPGAPVGRAFDKTYIAMENTPIPGSGIFCLSSPTLVS